MSVVTTPPVTGSPFTYSIVPTSLRDWLKTTTEQIHSLAYRTACDTIRMGRLIAEVKAKLKRRTFKKWASSELPWSRSHAYRLMAVADVFGPLMSHAETERIEPTALYLLARPEIPPEARVSAVQLADKQRVTVSDAKEIIEAHKRTPEMTPAAVRKTIGPMVPEKPGPVPVDAAPLWSAIRSLFESGATLHVSPLDEDDGEFPPLASVTVYRPDDRPRNVVRRHLADAILAAADMEPEKTCPSCEVTKPIGMFGDNDKEQDGRNRYCRECERARLLEVKAEAKARKAEGGT